MGDRIRVLIADDSPFIRRAVERMLSTTPQIEVVGDASTGAEAIEKTKLLRPDVVILDVNMPEMDGLEALRAIMAEAPTGVLMLSTLTSRGARITMNALELGAVDFLDKSSAGKVMDIYGLAPQLREKVIAVAGAALREPGTAPTMDAEAPPAQAEPPVTPAAPTRIPRCQYDVIVVGASTGGPRALSEVLSNLPKDLGAGVVIAQHMPAGFTQTLADRLDRRSQLAIREAADGDVVRPGEALVSPGGTHLTLERRNDDLVTRIDDGPTALLHRPNVDLLFDSAVATCGDRVIGVVLTGMGDDGSRGLAGIREAGGRTIAESEETAIIYGMPRAAASAAERVLPLPRIADRLVSLCSARSRDREP